MTAIIIFVVSVFFGPLLLNEFTDWLPWVATRLIWRAATHLPIERRARYAEEWAAEFSALPGGKLTKLAFGLRLYAHARTTGAVLREEVKAEQKRAEMTMYQAEMTMDQAEMTMDTAARVLSLAQQTADQAIADATREADATLRRARQEAEKILTKAQRRAAQIASTPRNSALD